MRVKINDIKIIVKDTITSLTNHHTISMSISEIVSNGCDENFKIAKSYSNDYKHIYRIVNIKKLSLCVYQEKDIHYESFDNLSNDVSSSLIQQVDIDVKLTIPKSTKGDDASILKVVPKIKCHILIQTPLLIDISISKLNFIMSLLNYINKLRTIEKYMIHRPEFREDEKIDINVSKEWFKYAFKIIKEEVRLKKKKSVDFATLIEKVIYMERYILLYKASHKLIISPWINYNDCNDDLKQLEDKMQLEDIIYCREVAFTELITEGKTYCSSGEIGEGYKPLIHLWEFYVNDLKSKWKKATSSPTSSYKDYPNLFKRKELIAKSNNNDNNNNNNNKNNNLKTVDEEVELKNKDPLIDNHNQIELNDQERRDLMNIKNLDKNGVIMSYLKGEQNHPLDKMFEIFINCNLILISMSRKVSYRVELARQINHNQLRYNSLINKELKHTNFYKLLESVSEYDLKKLLLEEDEIENNEEDDINSEEENINTANLNDDNDKNYSINNEEYEYNDNQVNLNTNSNNLNNNNNNNNGNSVNYADINNSFKNYNNNNSINDNASLNKNIENNDLLINQNKHSNLSRNIDNLIVYNQTNTDNNYNQLAKNKNTMNFYKDLGAFKNNNNDVDINNIDNKIYNNGTKSNKKAKLINTNKSENNSYYSPSKQIVNDTIITKNKKNSRKNNSFAKPNSNNKTKDNNSEKQNNKSISKNPSFNNTNNQTNEYKLNYNIINKEEINNTNFRKNLLSILIGGFKFDMTNYRNEQTKIASNIFDIKIIDHNLTKVLSNYCNIDVDNIKQTSGLFNNNPLYKSKKEDKVYSSNFNTNNNNNINNNNNNNNNNDNLELNKEITFEQYINNVDLVYKVFNYMYTSNEYEFNNIFSINDEHNKIKATDRNIFETYLIKFLFDSIRVHKIRNKVLGLSNLEAENNFLQNYIYKFDFKEVLSSVDKLSLEDLYIKIVVMYFFEKDLLPNNVKNLYSNSSFNLNYKKNMYSQIKSNLSRRSVIVRLLESFKLNYPKDNYFKNVVDYKKTICEDLKLIFTEISINLIKQYFAPLYNYFLNDKNVLNYFKINMNEYVSFLKIIKDKELNSYLKQCNTYYTFNNNSLNYNSNIINKYLNNHENNNNENFKFDESINKLYYFISFHITLKGKNYPNYIDSLSNTNNSLLKATKYEKNTKNNNLEYIKTTNLNNNNNNTNNNIIIINNEEDYIDNRILNKNNTEIKTKNEGHFKQEKDIYFKNSLKLNVYKTFTIDISNETIAEINSKISGHYSDIKNEFKVNGNILQELKKSYLDIFDNFKKLRNKWILFEKLNKNKNEFKDEKSQEMKYLKKVFNSVINIKEDTLLYDFKIDSINIKVIDNLYFSTYEKIVCAMIHLETIRVNNKFPNKFPIEKKLYYNKTYNNKKSKFIVNKDININNNNNNKDSNNSNDSKYDSCDNLNSNRSSINIKEDNFINNKDGDYFAKELLKKNTIVNLKNFDFNLIKNIFHLISISVKDAYVYLDNQKILETDLKISINLCILKDLPFLPNNIIDTRSSKIKISLFPSIIKLTNLITNLKYFQNEYNKIIIHYKENKLIDNYNSKEYNHVKSSIYKKEENYAFLHNELKSDLNPNYNNKPEYEETNKYSSIVNHFKNKLSNYLKKTLENRNENKQFISYITTRTDTIIYYSVGNLIANNKIFNNNKDNFINNKFSTKKVIYEDTKENELSQSPTKLKSIINDKNAKDNLNNKSKNLNFKYLNKSAQSEENDSLSVNSNNSSYENNNEQLNNFSNSNTLNNGILITVYLSDEIKESKKFTSFYYKTTTNQRFINSIKNVKTNTHDNNNDKNNNLKTNKNDLNFFSSKDLDSINYSFINKNNLYFNSLNYNASNPAYHQKIICLYIPLLIACKKEYLFKEEHNIWISKIQTNEHINNNNLEDTLNIVFNPNSKLLYTPIELFMCKNFIESINFFLHNPNILSLNHFEFNDIDFPFDLKFKVDANNIYQACSATSYYYENNFKMYYKEFYPHLKNIVNNNYTSNNFNEDIKNEYYDITKNNIYSNFVLYINLVSLNFESLLASKIYSFIDLISEYQKDYNDLIDPHKPYFINFNNNNKMSNDNETKLNNNDNNAHTKTYNYKKNIKETNLFKLNQDNQKHHINYNLNNDYQNNDEVIKLVTHNVNISIYKIKISFTQEKCKILNEDNIEKIYTNTNNPKNYNSIMAKHIQNQFSFVFVLDNLCYNETISINGLTKYINNNNNNKYINNADNETPSINNNNNKKSVVYAELSLSNANLIISIPKIKNYKEENIDSDFKKEIVRHMEDDLNDLIYFDLGKIKATFYDESNNVIELKLEKPLFIGLYPRENNDVDLSYIKKDKINPLLIILPTVFSNLLSEILSKDKLDNIYNKFKEFNVNNNISKIYSLYVIISNNKSINNNKLSQKDNFVSKHKKNETLFFYQMIKITNIVKNLINANGDNTLKVNIGYIYAILPNSLFYYIYYVKNIVEYIKKEMKKTSVQTGVKQKPQKRFEVNELKETYDQRFLKNNINNSLNLLTVSLESLSFSLIYNVEKKLYIEKCNQKENDFNNTKKKFIKSKTKNDRNRKYLYRKRMSSNIINKNYKQTKSNNSTSNNLNTNKFAFNKKAVKTTYKTNNNEDFNNANNNLNELNKRQESTYLNSNINCKNKIMDELIEDLVINESNVKSNVLDFGSIENNEKNKLLNNNQSNKKDDILINDKDSVFVKGKILNDNVNTNYLPIEFLNLVLNNINVSMIIDSKTKYKDCLHISVNDALLNPFDTKYKSLVTRRNILNNSNTDKQYTNNNNNQSTNNNKNYSIDILNNNVNEKNCEININKTNIEDPVLYFEFYPNPHDNYIPLKESKTLYLKNLNVYGIFKCLLEIPIFFERCIEVLELNEDIMSIMESINIDRNEEKFIFSMKVENSTFFIPESSSSFNSMCINITKGTIDIVEGYQSPKVLIQKEKGESKLNPKPTLIIENDAIFNRSSIQTDYDEFFPCIKTKINADYVEGYFDIGDEIDPIAFISNILLEIVNYKNSNNLTKKRIEELNNKYSCKCVLVKPELNIGLNDAILKSSIGKLMSIKKFIDNNVDEKSKILFDSNVSLKNVEMDLYIEKGCSNMNVFKVPFDFYGNKQIINNSLPIPKDTNKSYPINKNDVFNDNKEITQKIKAFKEKSTLN